MHLLKGKHKKINNLRVTLIPAPAGTFQLYSSKTSEIVLISMLHSAPFTVHLIYLFIQKNRGMSHIISLLALALKD